MSEAIGYFYNRGGLNNQRQCLGGLFRAAYVTGCPIFLPEMFNLDYTKKEQMGPVKLSEIYEIDEIEDFANQYGIKIIERPQDVVLEDPFGQNFFGNSGKFLTPLEFQMDFSRALKPRIKKDNAFIDLADRVFAKQEVNFVLQLRIENDWIKHASNKNSPGNPDDYLVSYERIFFKIKNTFGEIKNPIYIVCDEAALPFPKEEIRDKIKSAFGIQAVWKTDIMSSTELEKLGALQLSVVDFEMAVMAQNFIGLTRSSFSNQVCWYKFCQTKKDVETHYIYNIASETLKKRSDNGRLADPSAATVIR